MDFDSRLENIESNYSRLADGMHRIAEAGEKTSEDLEKMNKTLIGYMDTESNKYVPGYIQKLENVEHKQINCLAGKKYARLRTVGAIVNIAVGVIILVVAFYLGVAH